MRSGRTDVCWLVASKRRCERATRKRKRARTTDCSKKAADTIHSPKWSSYGTMYSYVRLAAERHTMAFRQLMEAQAEFSAEQDVFHLQSRRTPPPLMRATTSDYIKKYLSEASHIAHLVVITVAALPTYTLHAQHSLRWPFLTSPRSLCWHSKPPPLTMAWQRLLRWDGYA
jgi:hypothetical protein